MKRFEDITVWQRSRELTRDVYKTFKTCRDKGFTDQIQRASISVMSNIAEGYEGGTKISFVRYLFIAKASAGEVRAQLYAAQDIGYLGAGDFERLKGLAEECSKMLSTLIKTIRSNS